MTWRRAARGPYWPHVGHAVWGRCLPPQAGLAQFTSVGAGEPGHNANQMLNLDNPNIDWVHMANASGMEAVRVSNIAAFGDAVRAALKRKGPFLIEAVF